MCRCCVGVGFGCRSGVVCMCGVGVGFGYMSGVVCRCYVGVGLGVGVVWCGCRFWV